MSITYLAVFVISVSCLTVNSSPLFPHGSSVQTLDVRDQFVYSITLTEAFVFFGTSYSQVHVTENGVVTFVSTFKGGEISTYTLDEPWITPFGADVGGGSSGSIEHQSFSNTDAATLQSASDMVNGVYSGVNFAATAMFVVTWRGVKKFPQSTNTEENTFQTALVTDGMKSFVVLLYETINWSPSVVGISAGDSATQYTVCGSGTSTVSTLPDLAQSQCGTAGVFVFRVDGTNWTQSGPCTQTFTPSNCSGASTVKQARDRRCKARGR